MAFIICLLFRAKTKTTQAFIMAMCIICMKKLLRKKKRPLTSFYVAGKI